MRRILIPLAVLFVLTSAQTSGKNGDAQSEPLFPAHVIRDSTAEVPFFRPKVIVHREIVLPKDPFLGGALSLALPGTGQAYCGKWLKGSGFLAGTYLSYILWINMKDATGLEPGAKALFGGGFLLLGLALHGWSVIDGVNTANAHNRRLLESP